MATSEHWTSLLSWLATQKVPTHEFKAVIQSPSESSHGDRRLVAVQDIPESTSILTLPHNVLLNTNTIPKEFIEGVHGSQLTSTQALTLFLTTYRSTKRASPPADDETSSIKYPFDEYLFTLPTAFPDIPLVWVLEDFYEGNTKVIDAGDAKNFKRLETYLQKNVTTPSQDLFKTYRLMTYTTFRKSHDVLCRFIQDWSSLLPTLRERHPSPFLEELIWAWLIVNTRSVSFDLGHKDHADNIVLAPAFDMANHSPTSRVTAVVTPHALTMYSSAPTGRVRSPLTDRLLEFSGSSSSSGAPPRDPSSSSSSSSQPEAPCVIRRGEDITFSYGPHSNPTLLAEYGFIASPAHNPWDSIDVTPLILALFRSGYHPHLQKIDMLKTANYWEDYTIQCDPLECSHRILVALRLLHTASERVSEWWDHVEGQRDEMDEEVEDAVRTTVDQLFSELSASSRALLNTLHSPVLHPAPLGLSSYAFQCLKTLAINESNAISSYPSGM
ncbi:hypothetical protein PCANC_06031 [Puccinia coronata f. sp. avenae]|uniref:Uncharacterized protein n=1 Tax=Puccinia coronata f. sp. avenae TaxID=200324 RepID=A0A2N5T550_9BASI|nr:hypothetical protein PCANC_06031 [Puccinia coronata f. sp. avenae]PLW20940.1 hypothetical protein PCASD_13426 [Puccinia coronata f. sp. avenae]